MPAGQSPWKENEISKYHEQLLPGQACSLWIDDGETVEPQARSGVGTSEDQRKGAEHLKHPALRGVEVVVGLWPKRRGVEDLDP